MLSLTPMRSVTMAMMVDQALIPGLCPQEIYLYNGGNLEDVVTAE